MPTRAANLCLTVMVMYDMVVMGSVVMMRPRDMLMWRLSWRNAMGVLGGSRVSMLLRHLLHVLDVSTFAF